MKKLMSSVFLSGALLLTFSNNSGYATSVTNNDMQNILLPKTISTDNKLNIIGRAPVEQKKPDKNPKFLMDDDNREDGFNGDESRRPSFRIEKRDEVEDDVHKEIAEHIAEAMKLLDNIEEILNRMYKRALRGEE